MVIAPLNHVISPDVVSAPGQQRQDLVASPTLLQNRAMKEPFRMNCSNGATGMQRAQSPLSRGVSWENEAGEEEWGVICTLWEPTCTPAQGIAMLQRQATDPEIYQRVCTMLLVRFAPIMEGGESIPELLPLFGPSITNALQHISSDTFFLHSIARVLKEKEQVVGVQCAVLNSLCFLSSFPAHVKNFVDNGVHAWVCASVNRHPSCLALQQLALALLSNLALHPLTAPPLLCAHVHTMVLEMLERMEDRDAPGDGPEAGAVPPETITATHACGLTALANLANALDDAVRVELANKNIHHICIHYLEIRGEKTLRHHAALVLRNLSVTPSVCKLLIESDVHVSAVNAIRNFKDEVSCNCDSSV